MIKIRRSIKLKLVLSLLLLAILPLIVVGAISYRSASKALLNQAYQQQLTVAQKTVEQMEAFLAFLKQNLQELSSLEVIKSAFLLDTYGQDLKDTLAYLIEFQKYRNGVIQIRLVNPNGTEILTTFTRKSGKYRDVSDKPWFKHAISGEQIYVSPLYFSEDARGEPVFTISKVIKDSSGLKVGIVAMDIRNQDLTSFVDQIQIGKTGYGYIIDKTGLLVAHPQKDKILKENIYNTGSPSLKKVLEGMMELKSGSGRYTYEGIDKYVFYYPFNELGWSVGLTVPLPELMASVIMLLRTMLIVIIIVALICIALALNFSKSIVKPIGEVIGILKSLAEGQGDLTKRIIVASKDEIEELANFFNQFIASLSKMISMVRGTSVQVNDFSETLSSSVEQLNASAAEISNTIQNLSKGINVQASRVETAYRTIQNMEELTKKIASNAQVAVEASQKASEIAHHSGDFSSETIKKINGIKEVIKKSATNVNQLAQRSQQIGEIVKIISRVADQTNLLALNAAIEAARAGEAGRGFAVVAEEVRKLAEDSARSAENIRHLVEEIQEATSQAVLSMEAGTKGIAEGAELVARLDKSLSDIISASRSSYDMVEQIARMTNEQLEGTKLIVQSIQEIDQIAGESSASAEEVSSSAQEQTASTQEISAKSQELSKSSNDLESLVGKFKLRE